MNRRRSICGFVLLALCVGLACSDRARPQDSSPSDAAGSRAPSGGAGRSGDSAGGSSSTTHTGRAGGTSSTGEPSSTSGADAGPGDVTASAGSGGGVTTVTTSPPELPTGVECLGTRIDIERHSASCGACENACPAITLASGIDWPTEITLDETTAYWITSGADGVVMSAPVDGSSPAVVLSSSHGWPADIAVDATSVYWASDSIFKMPLAGGMATRLVDPQLQVRAQTLAVDATHVYWGGMDEGDGSDGLVMKVPLDGGMPVTLVKLTDATPYGIAVDASSVYWAHGADAADRQIMKVPLDGGTPVTLAMGAGEVFGFAIDATHAYWTSYEDVVSGLGTIGASTVMSVPLAGGTPTVLASGTQQPMALAIDGARAYWTNASNSQTYQGVPGMDGTVIGVPLAGGTDVTLGPNQYEPAGVAANGTTVCWTNMGAGRGAGSVMCLGVCESGLCR